MYAQRLRRTIHYDGSRPVTAMRGGALLPGPASGWSPWRAVSGAGSAGGAGGVRSTSRGAEASSPADPDERAEGTPDM
jgi:hypothetical protein